MTGRRIARVYSSLRTAHLERFAQAEPSTVLYRRTNYDFDPAAGGPGVRLRKAGPIATPWHLLTHGYDVVEVNEPGIAWLWRDLCLQLAAVRLRSVVTRSHTAIVTYCIAVVEPADDAVGHRFLPRKLVEPLSGPVLRLLTRSMDRIAFGTPMSRRMYARFVGDDTLRERGRRFDAVPGPCECLTGAGEERDELAVVFVGAFSDRKGIGQLMRAWDSLSRRRPELSLTLLGKGAREGDVQRWAQDRPEVTVEVDPPRERIHRALRTAGTAVLLSQRVGGWREQVGLPIVEALAHGCEVVTTDETGLADWLGEHGHLVVSAAEPEEVVAGRLEARIDAVRPRASVLQDLPEEDQRLAADRWMVMGGPTTGTQRLATQTTS